MTQATSSVPSLGSIRAVINDDLQAVDLLIKQQLTSSIPLIEDVICHILKSGGKRARPLLLLLTACACNYNQTNIEHHELACVIEFIHTATLLHDDVVDHSDKRRGEQTANAVWSNSASVLVGDFLYSRAFQILAKRDNVPVMRVLADTTNQISEGEMLQLANQHQADCSTANYYRIIESKTAALFAAASQIGAMLAQPADTLLQTEMHTLGFELGIAFQIVDDLLDYVGDTSVTGKNLGDDLQEGKITLPVILAIEGSSSEDAKKLKDILQRGDASAFPFVLEAIEKTDACAKCLRIANEHVGTAKKALLSLDKSPYRTAIEDLLEFVIARAN